jgi:serine/threonine-protein kinase HipA
MQALDVWMNGQFVGTWTQGDRRSSKFQYDADWIQSAYARPLSNALPMSTVDGVVTGQEVTNYFDNLLPDSVDIRKRIQSSYKTKSAETFNLLEAIGRDCVGAVQLLPIGETPAAFDSVQGVPLSDAEIAQILIATSSGRALGQSVDEESFRISIAGAQEKTALLRVAGQWQRPLAATPTTHILKLPLGLIGGEQRFDMTDSIENEWLCAKILKKLGFNIANTEIGNFDGTKALVVERFDRKWMDDGKWIARIPQEDFCQVFGLPSDKKYEDDGGPSIERIMSHLTASVRVQEDRLHFIKTQFVFWLLAATDGHAKNFSVSIQPGGAFQLTPLYDVLSAWPIVGNQRHQLPYQKARLAMAIRAKNTHYKISEICTRHWQEICIKLGVTEAFDEMHHIASNITAAMDDIAKGLPKNFPMHVIESIERGVSEHANRFLSMKEIV